ncbi:prepilin peptidase [Mobilitalea sibirica]|uniref:Prepilin peptidase n=1 Tax=Mobilitalea sibirica TaxID=1462919 RepID=A0A8J7GZ34_9FIRM|nr:prepilin peptidase [Mobilitalea sibirica]MBH1941019.1 prepilin peptidase [Mobilitalea sibirica]
MADTMIKFIIGGLLLLCAIQDGFHKKISTWFLIPCMALLVALIPFSITPSIPERIGGVLVGVGVIVISKATKGKIGIGDGILLCVTGMGIGFWTNIELFALALLAAAIVSIGLLALKRANRKTSIPFVPFLLLGYIVTVIGVR